jgi:SEC-C motif-containing protein
MNTENSVPEFKEITMSSCPCGSGTGYTECCEAIISGSRPAETAEQLMRARYSAYTNASMDFIFESTHPEHRSGYDHEGTKVWAENSEWLGLEILSTQRGTVNDSIGEVEFIARFRDKDGADQEHHECGQFKRKEGAWFFTEGSMVKPRPLNVVKIGRNDPCTCGSGSKYKKCCGK